MALVAAGPGMALVAGGVRAVLEVGGAVGNLTALYETAVDLHARWTREAPENAASLARLQSRIEELVEVLQSAEVFVPPRQLEAVEEQIAAVREFLQSCQTQGPQRQGVASECKDLEHSLDQVYLRLTLVLQLAINRQMSEERSPQARNVRRLLGPAATEGGLQVFTTDERHGAAAGEVAAARADSDDSRASTPPREQQDVWVALYNVEHENERGELLQQLRRELEGSRMLTNASLIMFDFMECAQVPDSPESDNFATNLHYWREEIRIAVSEGVPAGAAGGGAAAAGGGGAAAAGGEGASAGSPAARREDMMAQILNDFVKDRAVRHRILDPEVCPAPDSLQGLPDEDRRGCAHVVYHLVRSQLRSSPMKRRWERAFMDLPPIASRDDFFKRANATLRNEAVMQQCGWGGWARNGSSSVVFIRASRIWAYLACLAVAYDPGINSRLYDLGFRMMASSCSFAAACSTNGATSTQSIPGPGAMEDAGEGSAKGEKRDAIELKSGDRISYRRNMERPANPPGFNNRFKHKTQLCRYWKAGNCSQGARCSFAHGAHELADSNSSSPQYSNYSSPQQNLSQDSNFDAQGALQPLHTDHPALFGVGLGGKDKHADDGDRRTRVSETSDPEGNAVSGEGIRAAGARMLVRDLLLKSQNEALTEELVAEHAKQMLKTASADGHSISLTEFVQYAGQHRALFDQLLLQQRSSAPCGTMTDVDAVNINGDTVPAPLGKARPRARLLCKEGAPTGVMYSTKNMAGYFRARGSTVMIPSDEAGVLHLESDDVGVQNQEKIEKLEQFQVQHWEMGLLYRYGENEGSVNPLLHGAKMVLVPQDLMARLGQLFGLSDDPEMEKKLSKTLIELGIVVSTVTTGAGVRMKSFTLDKDRFNKNCYRLLPFDKMPKKRPKILEFVPGPFTGPRPGYVFKEGSEGFAEGYYEEDMPQQMPQAAAGTLPARKRESDLPLVDIHIPHPIEYPSGRGKAWSKFNLPLHEFDSIEAVFVSSSGQIVTMMRPDACVAVFSSTGVLEFKIPLMEEEEEDEVVYAEFAPDGGSLACSYRRDHDDNHVKLFLLDRTELEGVPVSLRSKHVLNCQNVEAVAYHPNSTVLVTCSWAGGDSDPFFSTKLQCWSVLGDKEGRRAGEAIGEPWISPDSCNCMAFNAAGTSLLKKGRFLEVWNVPLDAADRSNGSCVPTLLMRTDFMTGTRGVPADDVWTDADVKYEFYTATFSSCGDFLLTRNNSVDFDKVHLEIWDCTLSPSAHIRAYDCLGDVFWQQLEKNSRPEDERRLRHSQGAKAGVGPDWDARCPKLGQMAQRAWLGPNAAANDDERRNRLVFEVCSSFETGPFIEIRCALSPSCMRLACVALTRKHEEGDEESSLSVAPSCEKNVIHVTIWSVGAPTVEAVCVDDLHGCDGYDELSLTDVRFSACSNQLVVLMNKCIRKFDVDLLLQAASREPTGLKFDLSLKRGACSWPSIDVTPSWRVQCDRSEWRRQERKQESLRALTLRKRFASFPSVVCWNAQNIAQIMQDDGEESGQERPEDGTFKHDRHCCRELDTSTYGGEQDDKTVDVQGHDIHNGGYVCSRWLTWHKADSLMAHTRCALAAANKAVSSGTEQGVGDGGFKEMQEVMSSLWKLTLLTSSPRNFDAFVSVEDFDKGLPDRDEVASMSQPRHMTPCVFECAACRAAGHGDGACVFFCAGLHDLFDRKADVVDLVLRFAFRTFIKYNVTAHEVAMHRRAFEGGVPCPEIIDWEPRTGKLYMRRLPGSSVSDWYGEEAENVPPKVFARVRELVERLVDGCGMDFPDLTGYNVMIDFDNTDQMWLVDFEHAREVAGRAECCDFVQSFLKGKDSWNAEFA